MVEVLCDGRRVLNAGMPARRKLLERTQVNHDLTLMEENGMWVGLCVNWLIFLGKNNEVSARMKSKKVLRLSVTILNCGVSARKFDMYVIMDQRKNIHTRD